MILNLFRTNYFINSEMYLDYRHKALIKDALWRILATKDLRTWIWTSSQHPARVIGSLGRNKLYGSIYRILDFEDRDRAVYTLREKEKY